MKYRLNQKTKQRALSLVRSGSYTDQQWAFSVADSQQLIGDPPNWTTFGLSFLGYEIGKPDALAERLPNDVVPSKDWFAYPIGKDEKLNVNAIREAVTQATAAGEMDVVECAKEILELVEQMDANNKTASGQACDRDISFSAPAKIRAKAKSQATFDADAYTGVSLELEGWTHPVVIDYDGIDVTGKSRPVLRDHDPKRPIAHTTDAGVKGGIFKASGVFSLDNADSREVVDSSKGDKPFPWQLSVGMKTLRNQFVPEGQSAQANGKTWDGPINIARQTALREISFLTLGADDNTSARIAAKAAKESPMKLKKKFAAWMRARNIKMEDMADDGFASAMKSAYKAAMKCEADDKDDEDDDGEPEKKDPKSAATPADIQAAAANAGAGQAAVAEIVAQSRKAAVDEFKRSREITAMLGQYEKDMAYSDEAKTKFNDIAAKVLSGEISADKAENILIKAARPTVKNVYANVGAGSTPDGAVFAAAAARSAGVGEKAAYKGLNEQQSNIAASIPFVSIHKIISASAARMGMHFGPGDMNDSFLQDFIPKDKASHREQKAQIRASSGTGFSTMSLTGITENILWKAMLEMYNMQKTVRPEICYERDTQDFKPFKVYRLTAAGDFEPVAPTGDITTLSLQDESYTNQVSTRAALLTLKREDIINDDMGALMQSPQVMGRKAALNLEKQVITTLISGLSTIAPGPSVGKAANTFDFYSSGAKNYLSGASSALSIASVTTAVTKFIQQTDANGDPIGLEPTWLLVGPENYAVADNLFQGANLTVQGLTLPTSGAQTGSQVPNLNQHRNKYKPLVTPYFGSASPISGATSTQWCMGTTPAGGFAPIQVGYLKGQRTPIIRQVEVDATMLGIAFQAIFDFGVALLDYRTSVYSAGA
jgi:hypothetical protein